MSQYVMKYDSIVTEQPPHVITPTLQSPTWTKLLIALLVFHGDGIQGVPFQFPMDTYLLLFNILC